MTKTAYSGNPAASLVDAVRFEVGDTESDTDLLDFTDEEIAYALSLCGNNVLFSAAWLAESMVARVAKEFNYSSVGTRENRDERTKHFRELALRLRQRAGVEDSIVVTGLSKAEQEVYDADSDLIRPKLQRGLFDYYSTSSDDEEL